VTSSGRGLPRVVIGDAGGRIRLDGVMVPAAGRGGATEFPFYLCSIRRDDFALALIFVVSGISRGSNGRGNSWDPTSLHPRSCSR
jgi:hypothetical protein